MSRQVSDGKILYAVMKMSETIGVRYFTKAVKSAIFVLCQSADFRL